MKTMTEVVPTRDELLEIRICGGAVRLMSGEITFSVPNSPLGPIRTRATSAIREEARRQTSCYSRVKA